MADTHIEWTDKTWNPTTGCDKVSPGCDNCYALTMAKRLKGMGQAKYQNDGDPRTSGPGFLATEHEADLGAPLRWRKPAKVFVNSMSDLFHERISDEFIARVFAVMAITPRHTYQVLTKRQGRMRSLLSSDEFRRLAKAAHSEMQLGGMVSYSPLVINTWPPPNVWLGVSVENQKWADIRIPALLGTPAAVRFLSCEPLLGPVNLSRYVWDEPSGFPGDWKRGVDWVIVGGESGRGARPMHPDWARQLRDQCAAAAVPFHFKQWGEWGPAPWSVRVDRAVVRNGSREEREEAQVEAESRGATHYLQPSGHLYEPPHRTWSSERDPEGEYPGAIRRWGKKAAGRELDGRTWDEFPAVSQ